MGKHVYYIEYKQFLVKDGVYSEYLSVFLFYSYVSIAIKAFEEARPTEHTRAENKKTLLKIATGVSLLLGPSGFLQQSPPLMKDRLCIAEL